MSRSVSNVSRTLNSVNQSAHTANYTFVGHGYTDDGPETVLKRIRLTIDGVITETLALGSEETGLTWDKNFSGSTDVTADEAGYGWYARVGFSGDGTYDATPLYFKSAAVTAVIGALSVTAGPTSTTATIQATYYPNVLDSTATAQLQYKKTTDTDWTNAGTAGTLGGYVLRTVSANLTGLFPSTQYQYRLVITRTTVNATSLTSSVSSFTTLAGEPLVTTNAATGVAATSANLNGTLDINDGTAVNVHFVWDTANPPVANVTANQPKSADGAFQQAISGLTASTLYYFKAITTFATPTGSPNEGSVLSFTTPADPAADSLLEDHVFPPFEYDRTYGVATTVYFATASPAATSSDRFFNAASPFVAGDVQVSYDGGATWHNVLTLPSRLGTTPWFSQPLAAAEMVYEDILIQIVDQNGPAFRDALVHIRTKIQTGQLKADPTQIAGNTPGMHLIGIGTSPGLLAAGGATAAGDITGRLTNHVLFAGTATAGGASSVTLPAGASTTDDWYNGSIVMIIGGVGAGQSRVITDYNGTTLACTVNRSWATNPNATSVVLVVPGPDVWKQTRGTELSAIPDGATGTFEDKVQLLYQRFAFKITQTATVQTLFKLDDTTPLDDRSVGDNGVTQTIGRLGA